MIDLITHGLSATTMIAHLSGGILPEHAKHHPHDVWDFRRCRRALAARPDLAAQFDEMRTCTPEWAALVPVWGEIERLIDEDGGAWSDRAYKLMRSVLDPIGRERMRPQLSPYEELREERDRLQAECDRLTLLINTPRTDDFFEAVRIEAAHQVDRWGVEHDAGKRPEDWITLYTYLLGKAARAHYDGNRDKLLHHIITVAAVALNWHRNATGENTRMRPGVAAPEGA